MVVAPLTVMAGRSDLRGGALSVACIAAVLVIVCSGCGRTSARQVAPSATALGWQTQAQQLLHRYGLQATIEPTQIWRKKLRFRPTDMGFVLYADASQSIGLDLKAHAGQQARAFSMPVRHTSPDGPLSAVFIIGRGEVIGACLLYNATPGVMSLAGRPGT